MCVLRRSWLALLAAAFAVPGAARAQSASAAAVLADVDHPQLGRLAGGAVRLSTERAASPVSYRLRGEQLVGSRRRTGVLCPGPGGPSCAAEPLRDRSTATSVTGGVAARVVGGVGSGLALVVDAGATLLRSRTAALATGRAFDARRVHALVAGGIEGTLRPVRRWPLAIEVGATTGGSMPLTELGYVDGYAPLEDGMRAQRVMLGLAWRP